MVDNTVLHFSDYKDKWRTAGFKKIDNSTTSAFVGGTPRYFRVSFESQTAFNMREISVTTTEQAYIEDSLVLLDNARNGEVSPGRAIAIQNVFNKPFDLIVDIPRDLVSSKNVIFYNTLNSYNALNNSVVGPACILYKNSDYVITYNRGQCANNCYTYGLNNLIADKNVYYSLNTFDWIYHGTAASGISLGFSNEAYLHRYKFYGSITPVSSKFWRFTLLSSDRVIVINDIIVKYLGERIRINKILLPDYIPSMSLNYINNDGSSIPTYYTFKDSFSSGTFDEFSVFGTKSPEAYVVSNNYLYINGRLGTINLNT